MINRYVGCLIRQKRLEQNLSQEGLCKGICVVSYLSKIEQGQVNPAPEIIEQLFERLNLHFLADETKLEELQELLRQYYDALFHYEDTEHITVQMEQEKENYENSELNLKWKVYQLYQEFYREHGDMELKLPDERVKEAAELGDYVNYMDRDTLFLYAFFMANVINLSDEERMQWFTVAMGQKAISMVPLWRGHLCFKRGRYIEAVRLFEEAYHMATEEGNADNMLEAAYLLGVCYSNYDPGNMMRYFERAMELARWIRPEMIGGMYYNIGATYTGYEEYEKAVTYLKKAEELMKGQCDEINLLLLYHKLSFAYIQLGNLAAGREYLEAAKPYLEHCSNRAVSKMLRLIEMRLEENYLDNPEYEILLKELYDTVGDELGFGFREYHAKFLIELYKYKRRYKDALEITNAMNRSIWRQYIS